MQVTGGRCGQADSESLHQRYALVLVMLVATACRFYHVDFSGLWGPELYNAIAVLDIGWKDMVSGTIYGSTQPPGYKTVLYWISQWLGRSAFELRLPSLVAGISSVAMLYVLGRRIHSSLVGLLAAAVLAASYKAITLSQDAQSDALLLLLLLLNFHAFLAIFFGVGNVARQRQFNLDFHALAGEVSFLWRPSVPVAPSCLLLFWISGFFLIYLSYLGLAIVAAELLMVLIFRRQIRQHDKLSRLLKVAYIPLLLSYLPWLPVVEIHLVKILPRLVINASAWRNAMPLQAVVTDSTYRFTVILNMLMLLPLLYGLLAVWQSVRGRDVQPVQIAAAFFVLVTVILFLCSICLPAVNYETTYLFLYPLLLLIWAAWLVRLGMLLPYRLTVVAVVILAVGSMVGQLYMNSAMFSGVSIKPDIRPWIRMIARDGDFMRSVDRQVFVSFSGVNHYLDRYGIVSGKHGVVMNAMEAGEVDKVDAVVNQKVFYYIGIVDRPEMRFSSPLLDALLQRYGVVCSAGSEFIRIIKFSTDMPPAGKAGAENCASRNVFVSQSTVSDRMQGL